MRVAKDKLNMVTLVGLDPEHQILSHVGRPERAGIALGIGSVHLGHCWNNHGGVDAPSADDVAYAPPPPSNGSYTVCRVKLFSKCTPTVMRQATGDIRQVIEGRQQDDLATTSRTACHSV